MENEVKKEKPKPEKKKKNFDFMEKFIEDDAEAGSDHEDYDDILKPINVSFLQTLNPHLMLIP